MDPLLDFHNTAYSRRQFFRKSGTGLGMAQEAAVGVDGQAPLDGGIASQEEFAAFAAFGPDDDPLPGALPGPAADPVP